MKYFVDIIKPSDPDVEGTIAYPLEAAQAEKARIEAEHPLWLVDLVPLEGTP